MISSALAFALLCLLSAGHSAPLDCNHTRPLNEVNATQLEGSWALVAGSINNTARLEKFGLRESGAINVSIASGANLLYTRGIRQNGECTFLYYNVTLEGGSFSFEGKESSELSAHFIHTSCPDCMLMKMDVDSGERIHFYLFSKRRELEKAELDEFRSQVECLNMPPPVVKDPTKELC